MIAGLFVVQSLQLEHEQTPDQQKPTKPATDDDTDAKAAAAATDDGQRKGEADGMSEGEEAAAAAATTSSPAKSKHIKVRHLHLTDICACCIFDTLVKSCRIFTAC